MAERALRSKRALNRLFIDIEEQWHDRGSVVSQRPEILSYKLTPSEWQIVSALQQILKQFAIATDQLQGDRSTGLQNTGHFDEFLPTIEMLLDRLETAVNGWTIDISLEASDKGSSTSSKVWDPPPPPWVFLPRMCSAPWPKVERTCQSRIFLQGRILRRFYGGT
jgi:hypothetical protein